jgi:hypothetical protein
MYKLILFSISVLLLSCNSKKKEQKEIINSSNSIENSSFFNLDTLKGIYYGDIEEHPFRIVINYISNKHVIGYDVFKGLQRNIIGTFSEENDKIKIILNEPGDLQTDSKYEIEINKKDFNTIGKKFSIQSKKNITNFKLKKLNVSTEWEEENAKDVNFYNNENFTYYFYSVEDSIGTIDFNENGLCTYSEITKINEEEYNEELNMIKGNWKIKNGNLSIEWKENSFFPTLSKFKLIKDPESDYYYKIVGENREFIRTYY